MGHTQSCHGPGVFDATALVIGLDHRSCLQSGSSTNLQALLSDLKESMTCFAYWANICEIKYILHINVQNPNWKGAIYGWKHRCPASTSGRHSASGVYGFTSGIAFRRNRRQRAYQITVCVLAFCCEHNQQ